MTKAVEAGMPKLRIEEAAARRQARIDRGEEVIVGVNKYQAPSDADAGRPPRYRQHRGARAADRAARSRSARRATQAAGEAALDGADRGGARAARAICWRSPIEATRARATVGEISDALEKVFTRHRATTRSDLRRLWRRLCGRRRVSRASRREVARLRRGGRPPAAPAGRQARPGRPRPRRQDHRHRLRRYRLRRRYRPAVPDAGGSGAPGDRERRPCHRRLVARPPATRRWCRN